jgi:hypothetical protein
MKVATIQGCKFHANLSEWQTRSAANILFVERDHSEIKLEIEAF